jgi:CRISPR-associated endoribonuclease Cas6
MEIHSLSQQQIEWSGMIPMIKIAVDFTAACDAEVPLYNFDKYRGLLYNLIENTNPKLAFVLHDQKTPTQWSFSMFHMERFSKSDNPGYYHIKKGTKGRWFIATTVPGIARALGKNTSLQFGKMHASITRVTTRDETYTLPPDDFRTITLRLHTPAVFYRASAGTYHPLSEESILEWQLSKLEMLGIIKPCNPDDLRPYIRILRDDTEPRGASIKLPGNGRRIRIEGRIGYMTIKIAGGETIREHLWNLFHIGQFIGMGSNTNVGFGHYSIVKLT